MEFRKILSQNNVIRTVVEVAFENKIESYLIGGFVRDLILGKQSNDIDFVVAGDGIQFAELVQRKLYPLPKLSVFKNFGTAHFSYNGCEYEFVGARKESYSSHSRNPNVHSGTIDEDLKRRDFTINTLSISLNHQDLGVLHDTFNGLEDIKNKRIITPIDPHTTFFDDPLRMLRAIRFASQLDFSIDDNCMKAITELHSRIEIITPERISEEINKILMTSKPSIGFLLLDKTKLLDQIIPELTLMKGIDKVAGFAHKDVFYHTLEVLDNVAIKSENLWLRWAALFHDVGKPKTKKFIQGQGWTFHAHEIVGPRMVRKIFTRLKLPLNEKLEYVNKIVNLHLRPIALIEDDVTDSAIRRLLFDAGDDIDDLMLMCEADITSKNEKKIALYLNNFRRVREKLIEVESKDKLRNWQPPISGEIIMSTFNIQPSKEVGILKNAIKEAILDGIISNNFDEAFNFMINFAKQINIYPVKE